MKNYKTLILSLLSMFVFGCSNTSNSSSNTSNSSNNVGSSSSLSVSNTTSSLNKVEVESIELKIKNNRLKIGEKTTFEVNILPNNATDKSYNVISLNENILSINNNEITALNIGVGQIKVISNNKEDIKEIEVYQDYQNDIINLLNNNINNEKNDLSIINISSFEGGYDSYQEIEARYYKNSVNQIKKDYSVENGEKKDVISTEYKFIGNYNNKDYVITKTLPEAGYNDGIETELGNFNSKELYYDNNTATVGVMNSITKLANSSKYLLLNKANISKNINNQNIIYNLSYEEEITDNTGLTKLYSVKNMSLIFNNDKLINANYVQIIYKDYLINNKIDLTNATINTKKEYKYKLTWNGRLMDKDMLVNPSDYFLTSFDVKVYNDEALTNETSTFYVGEKIYYKIFDIMPSMAFVDVKIDVEGTGVYVDVDFLDNVTIKCTTTGKATITFSSNGIEKKINVVVQTPKPEKIEFDPEDEWTKHEVKVGKTVDLSSKYSVIPSNASKEVTFSIVSGNEYASLEDDLFGDNVILRGKKAGIVKIRVTSNVDKNVFDECDFRVVEE